MDIYIKRLQTRASRQGMRASKAIIRELYTKFVSDPKSPTEVELALVLGELLKQPTGLAITQPETIEITPESHPETWEKLQPADQTSEENSEESEAIAPQPEESALATTGETKPISLGDSPSNLPITQSQIQTAVEQHFGKESNETKAAILSYVAQDTFSTATELQQALAKLRQMKLDILMRVVSDHNKASNSDQSSIKDALIKATEQRQQESEAFFAQFESQLEGMRAAFGL